MKQPLTCSSTDVSLAALGRPHLYAQHCIMKCVHCSEYDRAAASALGIVHLYMTGAPAAFEHPVSPLPPCTLTHTFQEKVPTTWCLSRTTRSAIFPTVSHALVIWCEHAKHFPSRVQRCRSASSKLLLLPSLFPVCRLSFHLLASGGKGAGGTLERARVWRGKSGHVGLGERWREKGKKGRKKREGVQGVCLQGCVIRPGRFSSCCEQHTLTHPQNPHTGGQF